MSSEGQDPHRYRMRTWWVATLTVLFAASLALNVGLGWKVRRLGYAVGAVPAPQSLARGTKLPRLFHAAAVGGRPVTVALARDRPTVLYVFSPTCRWCAANRQNLRALVASAGGSYRFVGISLSGFELAAYLQNSPLGFPVYRSPDERLVRALRLGDTPQTVVISPDGRVSEDWVGAYAGAVQSQVERFFHVRLPGIAH